MTRIPFDQLSKQFLEELLSPVGIVQRSLEVPGGETQQQAIAEVRALSPDNPQRNQILRILANWKVTIELGEVLDADDQEVLMTLSQAYLEWEQKTEQRGMRFGKAALILTLLNARLGTIEPDLATEIQGLSSEQLDTLAVALLNFSTLADLERWLTECRRESSS